jgi:hypothetical protein
MDFIEPAGYVPYFSGLKTIDEVGLVDKQIQEEIKKDKANYWINTVKKENPNICFLTKIYTKERMQIIIKPIINY